MTTTPPGGSRPPARVAANEETTVLTPVSDRTDALDRIPVTQRRMWIIITAVLGVLVLASWYFVYDLWKVSRAWEQQVDDVVAQNYDLGERLATEQEHVVALQKDYDTTSEQLKVAQERVIALSAEAAQRDDNAEFYTHQINDLRAIIDTASSVSTALNQCIDYKNQLLERIRHAEDYDPAELATFEQDVNRQCKAATDASVLLQQAINE